MELSSEILILLFFVAAAAGFIDAMAGGGGLLTLPALLAVGIPPTHALATNKLQSSFGSFSASWYFVRNGLVNLNEMKWAIVCTFTGAAIGAKVVQYVDASILTSLIPLLLVAISMYFILMPRTGGKSGVVRISERVFAFSVGGGVGFYDGFFGPGTGSIFTVCFVALGHFSLIDATARTKVLNFTSNIAALILFIIAGLPIWKLGLIMAVGGGIGARMGAKVVISKGQQWIRPLVIMMSMLMAMKLLWQEHQSLFLALF
ncbi:TSUP family transporter [Vibrio ostreicida]|uniref:Probable membrane transporter protein n=1 Tax=Vibrio ostreicida TaxID=526588 RepID=A0ABT8BQJ4_9VIBR|nr:TSUP family transporter [Vibrio ostreicida]MDN3609181.1 TSUP family transporter [Vibrio ostreicida]NPD08074.1 TSUP family transporter [Vibrio ostreicida]